VDPAEEGNAALLDARFELLEERLVLFADDGGCISVEAPCDRALEGVRGEAVRDSRGEDVIPAAVGHDNEVSVVESVLQGVLEVRTGCDQLLRTVEGGRVPPVA